MKDGKEPGALRTIGELSAMLDVKQHVLRYWEQQFPMLQPLKRSGGRRYYRSDDVALVMRIDALVNRAGYTLKGARAAIEQEQAAPSGQPPAAASIAASPSTDHELRASLQVIRDRLAQALAA
ncbi:MerR family transcriptional regulator [Croceibacterium ferulae]|uniref:MerR family transcriptional regulator n=1 Tax=Croceibacterium ferulae TaxID=1854641 RepID=UPI000EB0168E|nr:MerR family transcriptional regulator [Croceibacterium ferulae]